MSLPKFFPTLTFPRHSIPVSGVHTDRYRFIFPVSLLRSTAIRGDIEDEELSHMSPEEETVSGTE